ncbi:MAG: putative Ig domain-containing protein [Acidobacteria bacterium]|nr:putative Ig domain-containing protein [Acidobacteriota bacterium]
MKHTTRTITSFSRSRLVLAVLSLALLALLGGRIISAHKGQAYAKPARKQTGKMRAALSSAPTRYAPTAPRTPAVPVEDADEKLNMEGPYLSEQLYGPFDYSVFLTREKNGEFPSQKGPVRTVVPYDGLANNNTGATGTSLFTQSETSVVAFGNNVVIGFNDSGSNAGGTNKFTGYSFSSDGGNTFTDGGQLPTNAGGDAGDPVLARNETTGRIYFSTLGFSVPTIQVFHSDDNGVTWSAPVNGTPGGASEDKQWIAVDNFAGAGNGNVYLLSRNFGAGNGIFFYRSTDNGNTFGPSGGTLIVGGNQGAYVTVGPDHAVYAFWFAGASLQVRKSTDFGVTFGAAVTVASGLVGGTNGDLGLTGLRQGTGSFSGFRSSEFPHAAVNPINGNLYVTYNNKGAGADKADVFVVQSTDGGATWSAPVKVNDDATTTDQWQPTLAVTPDGTKLGIFYYSRQEDAANNNLFKYYGRVASISGATLTFAPSFAVSSVASLPEFGRDSLINSVYMGDYNTAAATNGAFHVVWSDNRDDLAGGAGRKDPNVYYQKVPIGLAVTTTVPAVGAILPTIPLSYTVNFSDPIQVASVAASDFTVDGVPANTFIVNTPTQVIFNFASAPFSTQGPHTMAMAAGAVLRNPDNSPLLAFSGVFRYDALLLQVTSTVPPVGGVFTLPGPFTYDVNFNEPVDPASVQTSDLALSGIAGATVSGVTVLPGNTTARFTLSGITVEGTLTASIAAGLITDAFGNPGAAFTANYGVDIGTVPYPTPLLAKNPLGSLVYDPSIAGTINFAGDIDNFTLNLDPNQTLTLVVTATSAGLQPSVTLCNPSNTVIGSATAAAAGQNALLQTVAATAAGTYTFKVSGASNTTGNYQLQVILNAAQEAEGTLAGATNNTLGTAQDINASFITLSTSQASAQRGAVTGVSDNAGYSAAAVSFAFEDISGTGTVIAPLTGVDDVSTSIPIGFTFPFYGTNNTNVSVSSNGLLVFGGTDSTFTNSDLTTAPSLAGIAPFWDDQHTAGGVAGSNVFSQVSGAGPNQHLTIQWNKVRFFSGGAAGDTITYEAQLFADGRIQLNYQDLVSGTAAGNNGASATVGIKAAGNQGLMRLLLAFNNGPNAFVGTGQSTLLSPPNPTPDLYSFTASAGDVVTLGVKGQGTATANVDLLNSGGATIATGVGGSTNLDSVVSNFAIGAGGTYYARVTSAASAVTYNLVVTRNAAFDTEANDTFATAQPIGGNRGALGGIAPQMTYLASAVPFAFENISGTGTVVTALDGQDDGAATIPIGFNFPFFGANNTTVGISSNGLLTFGGTDTTFTNGDLTTSPALAGIAPFWDDQFLTGAASTHVYFQVSGSGANQHLTIQWNNTSFFNDSPRAGGLTYEAQLYADGRIQFNYQNLATGRNSGTNDNGVSATVGIKAAGTQGPNRLLLAFNNGPNAFVGTGQSTLIQQPPGDDWYSVTLGAGQPALLLETSTPSDGPGEFVNVLNPHIELYSPANVLLASGVALADGRNESLAVGSLAPGVYRIRVTSEASTTGEYFLTATGCPTYTLSALPPTAASNVPFTQTIGVSPNTGGPFSFSFTGTLPPGLTLSSAGVLSGTPTTLGSFNFRVTATAAIGCSGFRDYTLTIVCPTVTITPTALAAGTAGAAYSQPLSVSPAGSYTFSLAQGNLPSGLTLNASTGVISGLPLVTGTYSFGIKAQLANGCNATQSYTLIINCPTVVLSPGSLPNGTTGTAYSQQLSAAPAGGNYTFAVSTGTLPAGLSLNAATGLISGTPSANGSSTFTVTATGFGGCAGSQSYTIMIGSGGCPTISLPASLPNGKVGTLYNNYVTASPAGAYSYAVTAGSLPPGVTLFSSAGLLFGYPVAPGTYNFTITATQGACTGSQSYSVVVTP